MRETGARGCDACHAGRSIARKITSGARGGRRHTSGERRLANDALTGEEREQILQRILLLETEHRDLDDVIRRLVADPAQDALQLQRLKKRKLSLKDQLERLRARVIPDLIA